MPFPSLRGAPRSLVAGIALAIAVTAGFAVALTVMSLRDDRKSLELVLTALTGYHIAGVFRGRIGARGKLTRLFAVYSVWMGLATVGAIGMKESLAIAFLAGAVFLADVVVVVLLTVSPVDEHRSVSPLGCPGALLAH